MNRIRWNSFDSEEMNPKLKNFLQERLSSGKEEVGEKNKSGPCEKIENSLRKAQEKIISDGKVILKTNHKILIIVLLATARIININ